MRNLIFTLFILFGISYNSFLLGQVPPPAPCTTGGQPSCICGNSPLLCTFDDLNGYSYNMTTYNNSANGPDNPMCDGGNGTTSHNPTWFRFIALCENIDLTVNATNCTHGGLFGCNSRGIQLAVFPQCSWMNPSSSVACEVSDCLPPVPANAPPQSQTINVSMSGLIVGQTYAMVVDGCCRSRCNITISVTSPPCPPNIQPFGGPVTGEINACAGESYTYTTPVAPGGIRYVWTINGQLPPVFSNNINGGEIEMTYTHTWTTPGQYTLCVDTQNDCVPLSADPPPNCIVVNVYDAEAGTITAAPTPVCPNGTVNINVGGNPNLATGYSQYILIANSSGELVAVVPGTSTTFTWPTCADFTAYSYNYVTAKADPPMVGDNISDILTGCTAMTTCCEIESAPFSFQDNINPVITGGPPNVTFNCFLSVPPMPTLSFTDNCLGSGTIVGEQEDDYTNCDGGTITRTWEITDSCGNTGIHVQTITIQPVPPATFTPAVDITVSCDLFPPETPLPTLSYDNGLTGACRVFGTITATRAVDTMGCMGTVTYTWQSNDNICMQEILDDQVITINPPLEANFINPPADVTVACTDFPAANFLPSLSYTNGQTGPFCAVAGQIIPVQTVDTVNCEGTVTFTWEGNDRCGRPLSHIQVWTIEPPLDIAFINIPPDTATITCALIPGPSVLPPLQYSNGVPSGRCRISGTVIPVRTDAYDICGGQIEYLWEKTDSCGRSISYQQILFVDPAPEAIWINPPADVTLACGVTLPPSFMPPLFYSNGAPTGTFCEIAGSVIPTRLDAIEECEGTITFTWEFTDPCGRTTAHSQVYTLSPPDLPVWISPPVDETVASCSGYDFDALPPLFYNNFLSGAGCQITGSVIPVRTGSVEDCQGAYTYTWTFIDQCNRTITHTKVVTVIPPPAPAFVNPPANNTVTCENEPDETVPLNLSYTNNGTGMCLISGTIPALPQVVESPDCSKVYTYDWTFTDFCSRTITHTLTINVDPPLAPQWINPPADITVASCSGFNFDALPPLFYNNGQTLNGCGINGSDVPVRTGSVEDCEGAYTYNWEFMDQCGRTITHSRTVTVIPPPEPAFVNPPASETVSCENAPDVTIPLPLNYTNGINSGDCAIFGTINATPSVISNPDCSKIITYEWEFTDACDRMITHTRIVNVDPPLAPTWINPPVDITVESCSTFNFDALPPLFYTNGQTLNGCGISGSDDPVRTGSVEDCAGAYTYMWEFMDQCGRSITHSRTVTVIPPPEPAFVNPPASETVSCENAPDVTIPLPLNYTNGATGPCLISGTINATPSVVSNPDCSKIITYEWEFTDACDRTITHTKIVNVDPPSAPQWINPPTSLTVLSCDGFDFDELPPLSYNNGQTLNGCGISGTVAPVRSGNVVDCQGEYTYTWEFMDQCGRTITHIRTITVNPPPPASFVNPPPSETLACVNTPDPGVAIPLNYTNGLSGDCAIVGTINAVPQVQENPDCSKLYTYVWEHTDFCGRTTSYTRTINVLPPPPPTFTNPPASTTLTCTNAPDLNNPPILNYTNGLTGVCGISGSVSATINSNIVNCQATYQLQWEYTDQCGRNIVWSQTITVLPPAEPTFQNPPPPLSTVQCTDEPDPTNLPVLQITNSSTGSCLITADVIPTLIVAENNCAKIYTYTWEYTDLCDRRFTYTRVVNVLPPPVATLINPPVYTTLTCADAELFNAPDINYSNNSSCLISGSISPVEVRDFRACGGNITINWNGVDDCNRPISYSQIIVVLPSAPPVITSPLPADVTISCQDLSAFAIPLAYSNGISGECERSGEMLPILSTAGVNLCGGNATVTWTITDQCGTKLDHVQNILVQPTPAAVFLDLPPANIQVECVDIPAVPPALFYSNGEDTPCEISGSVIPIQTGSYNQCGGTIQYTWQFTDACGRPIVYNQNVNVLPAPDPFFTEDPIDVFLPCNVGFPTPQPLSYTNGLVAPCAISGSVNPTFVNNGNTRIYTWTYRNGCTGTDITVDQEVTIVPVPNIIADRTSIEICLGEVFDLAEILVTDLNNTNITLTYHNGTPASPANEIPSAVTTDVFTSYYILATNEFGCTDEVEIKFINVLGPQAGVGQTLKICNDGRSVNLWSLLTPPFATNGFWSDTYATGINISNPANVSFAGQPANTYPFDYIVQSTSICPDAVATVEVELLDPGTYEVIEVKCAPDFNTYSVRIQVFGYNVTASAGTITVNGSIRTISNIPIGQSVTITLVSTVADCANQTIVVDPPQCDCPVIPNPVSGGNQKACQGQTGVALTVTVTGPNQSAQWFSVPNGGVVLQDKSLTYFPPTNVTGIFTYYVQAMDTLNACKSQRIPVLFEVTPNPQVQNATLSVCDNDRDGISTFDLTSVQGSIISGAGFVFTYHPTLADAQNNTNPLPLTYTNTTNGQKIFVVVTNTNNCKSIAEVTLNVLAIPNVTFNVQNEICFGANDGSITINPPTAGLEFKLNNLPWTTNPLFGSLSAASYTVQVRTLADLCVASYPLQILSGQRLSINTFDIDCDNKGTLSNANDDVYVIKLNIGSVPNASNTYTIRYNSVVIGNNYNFNILNTLELPANGSSGIIEIIDNVTGCIVTRNIGPLVSCSTNCEITVNNLDISCDNKGTDADASDDVYTISFVATSVNVGTSTQFSLLINNVISGTYNYGATVSFQLPANGTSPDIRIRDVLNISCFTTIPVGSLNGCSGACSVNGVVSNILCNNNGTINDPSDDTFTFTIRVTGFNTSANWRLSNNATLYPYNTNVPLGPYPISGGNLALTIVDENDNQCSRVVNVTAPQVCSTPCVLAVNNIVIGSCDNNNTGNITLDDRFSITFVVNVVSGSTNFYNVTLGAQTFGPFTYGQVATINNLPANGQVLNLVVTDAINNGCTIPFTVTQSPCSICTQTVSAGPDIQLTCAQNTATLTATTASTGGVFVWTGPNGFNNTGQTVTTSTEGTYTITVTFPDQCVATDNVVVIKDANLPTANAGPNQELTCKITSVSLTGSSNLTSNLTYIWTNAAGAVIGNTATITVNQTGFYYLEVTNTLNNCKSGKDEVEVFNLNQQLSFITRTPVCSNSGTASTGTDDTYSITFNLANSTNATNQFRVTYLGNQIGVYNYNQPFVIPSVPADGSTRIYEFEDLVTGCKVSTPIGPLNPCSTECLLNITTPVVVCDDNGTESIDTDDTYTVRFNVTALNGGVLGRYIVTIDGNNFGTFNYGTEVVIPFNATGIVPFILVKDANIDACQNVVTIPALIPCSSKCEIKASVSNILCNDNNTINNPADDLYSFEVEVTGLNTSVGWRVIGNPTLNTYNTRVTFGPYPIAGGPITLNLVDNTSANCTATINVNPPAVCSEPCVIKVDNVIVLDCNNNNTGPITNDDYFSVRFTVNRISGSATNYNVSVGALTFGPFRYGEVNVIDNLPANGQLLTLNVIDNVNNGCSTQFTVRKDPCSSCNQTVDAGVTQTITCTTNVITLTGTATPGGSFVWTGIQNFNKTGNNVTTSTPGTYILSVTYPDQCVVKDSVVINKDANVPDGNGGPDKVLNCLVNEVQITGSTTNPVPGLTFIWTDSNGNQIGSGTSILVNSPGNYFFEVINPSSNCSSGKDEVVITEDKDKPAAKINADPGNLLDCIVGTIVLSGQPIANVIFNWQTGETFINNAPSVTINTEGIVTMTALDTINGCENTASIQIVDLQDFPILITKPAGPITCINNGVFISAGLSPSGPNLVFKWENSANQIIPGENKDSLYVTSPGTYYVILTDTINKCSNRDTFVVTRIGDFPIVNVTDDKTLLCGDNNTSLSAVINSPTGPTTLLWNTLGGTINSPNTQANINVTGAGVYAVEVTYTASGCKTTENVIISVDNDYPRSVVSSVNQETCKGEKDGSITINSVTGGKQPLRYSINGGAASETTVYRPLAPGNYNVEIIDANGCKTDTVLIVKAGVDIQLLASSPIELVYNESKIIEVITNLKPEEIASIKWTPNENISCDTCLSTTIKAIKDITYKVEIVDINGCSQSINITLRVKDNVIITVPNVINSSGGSNGFFTVFGNESVINVNKLAIYDRWGNLMFIKENFKPNIRDEGWDGTFLGQPVEQGVYVYIINYEAPSGEKVLSGDLTVIR